MSTSQEHSHSQVVTDSGSLISGLDKGLGSLLQKILLKKTAEGVGIKEILASLKKNAPLLETVFGKSQLAIKSLAEDALVVLGDIAKCRSAVLKSSLEMRMREATLRGYGKFVGAMIKRLNELEVRRERALSVIAYGNAEESARAQTLVNKLNHLIAVQSDQCNLALHNLQCLSHALVESGKICGQAERELGEAISQVHVRLTETLASFFAQRISIGEKEISIAGTSTVWTDEEGNLYYQSGLFHPGSPECQESAFEMYNIMTAGGVPPRKAGFVIGHEVTHAAADNENPQNWAAFRLFIGRDGQIRAGYQPFGNRDHETAKMIGWVVGDEKSESDSNTLEFFERKESRGDFSPHNFGWSEEYVKGWKRNPTANEQYKRIRASMEEC